MILIRTYYREYKEADLDKVLNLPLRDSDIKEIKASVPKDVSEVIEISIDVSSEVWVVIHDKKIEAVFGVVPVLDSYGDLAGIPWFLSTDKFNEFKITFAKESKKVIDYLLNNYNTLANLIDSRHTAAIKWLRWLGFEVHNDELFYLEDDKVPFYIFTMERGD